MRARGNFARDIAIAEIGAETGAIEFYPLGIDKIIFSGIAVEARRPSARFKLQQRALCIVSQRIKSEIDIVQRRMKRDAELSARRRRLIVRMIKIGSGRNNEAFITGTQKIPIAEITAHTGKARTAPFKLVVQR